MRPLRKAPAGAIVSGQQRERRRPDQSSSSLNHGNYTMKETDGTISTIDKNGAAPIKWTDCGLKSNKVTKKHVHDSTWSGFKELIKTTPKVISREDSILIKPAEFNGTRDLEGLQKIYAITGDYDGEERRIEDAVLALRKHKIESFVHPSFNWAPGEPRYRIYCLLKEPIVADDYARFVSRLNGVLGGILAPESWRPAQMWFASGNESVAQPAPFEVFGKCIDEIDGLPINSKPHVKKTPGDINDEEWLMNLGPDGSSRRDTRSDDELKNNLKRGEDIHGSMMILVARMITKGYDGPTLTLWRDQFVEWVRESRGEERARDVPGEFKRLMEGAIKKGFTTKPEDIESHLVVSRVESEEDLYPLAPPCYVEDLFYQDVCLLAGPGGSNKSTVTIYEAITTALGRPLYGHNTIAPMRTLFLSGEDEAERYLAKIQRITGAMGLTKEERLSVYKRVSVIYVGNMDLRLCTINGKLITTNDKVIDALIRQHSVDPFDRIIIDPLVSFGVGEDGAVNDAHQGLIKAGRILRDNLHCMVEFVHHTGKANAQAKANDQYSFRGGSALADGSRLVRMVHSFFAGHDDADWRERTGLGLEEGVTGIEITTGKQTYSSKRGRNFMMRNDWEFVNVQPLTPEDVVERKINAARCMFEWIKANHETIAVSRYALHKTDLFDRHISGATINLDENNDKIIKTKTQARRLFEFLIDAGCIESVAVQGKPNQIVIHEFKEGAADEF